MQFSNAEARLINHEYFNRQQPIVPDENKNEKNPNASEDKEKDLAANPKLKMEQVVQKAAESVVKLGEAAVKGNQTLEEVRSRERLSIQGASTLEILNRSLVSLSNKPTPSTQSRTPQSSNVQSTISANPNITPTASIEVREQNLPQNDYRGCSAELMQGTWYIIMPRSGRVTLDEAVGELVQRDIQQTTPEQRRLLAPQINDLTGAVRTAQESQFGTLSAWARRRNTQTPVVKAEYDKLARHYVALMKIRGDMEYNPVTRASMVGRTYERHLNSTDPENRRVAQNRLRRRGVIVDGKNSDGTFNFRLDDKQPFGQEMDTRLANGAFVINGEMGRGAQNITRENINAERASLIQDMRGLHGGPTKREQPRFYEPAPGEFRQSLSESRAQAKNERLGPRSGDYIQNAETQGEALTRGLQERAAASWSSVVDILNNFDKRPNVQDFIRRNDRNFFQDLELYRDRVGVPRDDGDTIAVATGIVNKWNVLMRQMTAEAKQNTAPSAPQRAPSQPIYTASNRPKDSIVSQDAVAYAGPASFGDRFDRAQSGRRETVSDVSPAPDIQTPKKLESLDVRGSVLAVREINAPTSAVTFKLPLQYGGDTVSFDSRTLHVAPANGEQILTKAGIRIKTIPYGDIHRYHIEWTKPGAFQVGIMDRMESGRAAWHTVDVKGLMHLPTQADVNKADATTLQKTIADLAQELKGIRGQSNKTAELLKQQKQIEQMMNNINDRLKKLEGGK